jgi:RNA polymerase sigma-70 factor (ECF subfamily)
VTKESAFSSDKPHDDTRAERFFGQFMASQNQIYTYILMAVHNINDADDLMQETATVLWEKFDEFEEGRNFTAWGIGIARNKILAYLRDHSKTRAQFEDDMHDKIIEHAQSVVDEKEDRMKAIKKCLGKLDDKDRKLISMRYDQNITIKKMSQLVGRSVNGLYKTMARIHNALQNCVQRTMTSREMK